MPFMKVIIATVLLALCVIGFGQDKFPDFPDTPTRHFVESLIEDLHKHKVVVKLIGFCKPPPPLRYERAVTLHVAYQTFIDPKVRARLGSGYADIVLRVGKACALHEKELASLGVDVEAMKLHLRALALGEGFPDVAPNHWASKATRALKELGLLKGYPDGTFR